MSNDLRHIAIISFGGLSFATFSFFSWLYRIHICVFTTTSMLKMIVYNKRSEKQIYQEIPVKVYKSELFSLVKERGNFCPCAAVFPSESLLSGGARWEMYRNS